MVSFTSCIDLIAVCTPGLFLGRLANFTNAELWGRPTQMPWELFGETQACLNVMACALVIIQLYEAALEVNVFIILLSLVALRKLKTRNCNRCVWLQASRYCVNSFGNRISSFYLRKPLVFGNDW